MILDQNRFTHCDLFRPFLPKVNPEKSIVTYSDLFDPIVTSAGGSSCTPGGRRTYTAYIFPQWLKNIFLASDENRPLMHDRNNDDDNGISTTWPFAQ